MAYDSGFLRLSFLYNTGSTDEIAETQVILSGGPGSDVLASFAEWDAGDLLDSAQDLYDDVLNTGVLNWANYSRLHGAKLSAIDTSGHLLADPLVTEFATPFAGTVAQLHPQLTVVMSFWSGHTLGKGNYGRMYLPHTSSVLGTGLPITIPAVSASIASAGAAFINDMKTRGLAKSHQVKPVIASKAGAGSTKDIAWVRVSATTDTQRRRYNAYDVDYQKVAV